VIPEPLTLTASDGVRLDGAHLPGPKKLCIVQAHGFTCHWRQPFQRAIADRFHTSAGVLSFDFRGHGRSGGRSTVGDLEVLDLEAAVHRAHELGYERIAVAGFSMGGAVAVRHAALHGGIDALAAVSSPARWYYRGTPNMRRVHWAIERRTGRLAARLARGTRIAATGWNPVPEAPHEVAGRIAPTPLLVVHGDADSFFPLEHAEQLYGAARDPRELWIEPSFGHAEAAASPELIGRISDWLVERAGV